MANKAGATRANLKQANITAKKSLGQNFLTDENVLRSIVAAAGVTASDVVLEVGPGTGNLTRFLVATGAQVIAVEKDDTLVERLREEFKQSPNLQLIHGDILRVGIPGVLQQMQRAHDELQPRSGDGGAAMSAVRQQPQKQQQQQSDSGHEHAAGHPEQSTSTGDHDGCDGGGARAASPSAAVSSWRRPTGAGSSGRGGGGGRGLKVVANLPYNITKDFLKAMLPLGGQVSELSIMIQHEVAERLVDPTPGRPDYRAFSVYTHYYSTPKYRLRIPRQKYFPVPGVDGALVTFRLTPHAARRPVPSERSFHVLVAKAFSERRKMMRNSMQPMFTPQQVEGALVECGLRRDARAQDLSVDRFVALHWALHNALVAPDTSPARADEASGGGDKFSSGSGSGGDGGAGGGGGGGSSSGSEGNSVGVSSSAQGQ